MATFILNPSSDDKESIRLSGKGTVTLEGKGGQVTAQILRNRQTLDLKLDGLHTIRFSNKTKLKLGAGMDYDVLKKKLLASSRVQVDLPSGSSFSVQQKGKEVGFALKIKL
ncbi:MAG TPA: hypothetical protein VMO47_04735 [Rhodothermales bacterium]|nr:hypothetical protein [Rhodothermales bacterium]